MTAQAMTQMTQVDAGQPSDTVASLLQAASTVRQYMRRIPPDCRTSAIAALAELERRIREMH